MNDKEMVNDMLSTVNSSLTSYANAIAQSANGNLRETFQQMRNSDEVFQYNLFKLAEQKGFYKPAQNAPESDIQKIKSELSQG